MSGERCFARNKIQRRKIVDTCDAELNPNRYMRSFACMPIPNRTNTINSSSAIDNRRSRPGCVSALLDLCTSCRWGVSALNRDLKTAYEGKPV